MRFLLGLVVVLGLLGVGYAVGRGSQRRQLQARSSRVRAALPVVTALRALSGSDPLGEPAQHRLLQLQALEALEGWDRAALEAERD